MPHIFIENGMRVFRNAPQGGDFFKRGLVVCDCANC